MSDDIRSTVQQLMRVAEARMDQGDLQRAALLAAELEEARRRLAPDDPVSGTAANLMGEIHRGLGHFLEAKRQYETALGVVRRTEGDDTPGYATVLNNLGLLLLEFGAYGEAEPLLHRASVIDRDRLGESHPDYARDLNNLAVLHDARGQYDRSVPLYRKVLEILGHTSGTDDPNYAATLNNLAEVHRELGRYEDAVALYRRALEIDRRVLGDGHPGLAIDLNNLAIVRQLAGEHAEAESLYSQAEAIWRRSLGESHPQVAYALNNRAELARVTGRYDEAARSLDEALVIRRASLGDRHPLVAATIGNIGQLHRERGAFDTAEPLLETAISIQRDVLGEAHPDLAKSLTNLAILRASAGRPDEGLASLTEASAIDDRILGHAFAGTSERQRMAYLEHLRSGFWIFLSLVQRWFADSSPVIGLAFDLVLRRKGLAAEALAAQREAILEGRHPALAWPLRQLSELRMEIARATLAGPGGPGWERLPAQRARRDRLEEELSAQIPEMGLERALRESDRHAVARALPEGSQLLEFVRYRPYDFDARGARGDPVWQRARYVCFVLAAANGEVAVADLGDAEEIDRLIAQTRAAITGMGDERGAHSAGSGQAPGTGPASVARTLTNKLLGPLWPLLAEARVLFVAPDGDLARLPFGVLPDQSGAPLIDSTRISYLTVGRDLVRFGGGPPGAAGRAVVAADPDYDLAADDAPAPQFPEHAELARRSRDLDASATHFARLPATRREGQRIGELLGVTPLLGTDALESRIKSSASPRILHVATHGFFLPDQGHDPNTGSLADRFIDGSMTTRLAGLENPLLRSGLALSGANTWLRNGHLPPEAEDGILTAEDVSGLDLTGTELVVLSACDTGLGDVRTGEGVFGLRRAFVVAGAQSLVMSLWPVGDQPTQVLMERFYEHLLRGEERAEALRKAQLEVRSQWPPPAYWGAFICQGVPGPLTLADHGAVGASSC